MPEQVEQQEVVDESMMSARDLIAQEMDAQEKGAESEEAEEGKGQEAGSEGKAPPPEGEAGEKQKSPPRAYTAYTGDKEAENYEALDGLKVKFRANQEDQELSVAEMVREVQRASGISSALKTRTKERDSTNLELTEMQELLKRAQGDGDLLLKVLQDDNAYKELKAKFLEAGGTAQVLDTKEPEGQGTLTDEQLSERHMESGRGVVENVILPFSEQLAKLYDADAKEIAQEIIGLAGEVPSRYFSEEALEQIVNEKIPAMLMAQGFTASGEAPVFNWDTGNGEKSFGIQKKGSPARGVTEQETKLEARIKELESQVKGSGKKDGWGTETGESELEKDLATVPDDEAGKNVESQGDDIDLEGADSAASIMKKLAEYGD